MKNSIFLMCLILFFGCVGTISVFSQSVISRNAVGFDVEGIPRGIFCNVDNAEVCIITKDEKDCAKLNGKKVKSCPIAEESEK